MADRGQIWQCAQRELVLRTPEGRDDVFLWEHSRRVAENVGVILALPKIAGDRAIDRLALEAAALYHDAGWACQYRDGTVKRCELLGRPTSDAQRELGARLLAQSLANGAHRSLIESAMNWVRRLNDRPIEAVEVQVISDAENLDEIGNLSLWGLLRRHAWEGKGVDEAVRTWKQQREFRFWEARIDSSFHFEAVKRFAAERLERVDRLVQELAHLHFGDDLTAAIIPAAQG